jgi:DNA-binding transcriptional LysR family regulator
MNTAPFSQLQMFLTVARLQSFSGAARELGLSRSAVSRAVQQLEEQLRVVLLARTTRSVSLTDAGKRLVDSAGPALRQSVAALTEVAAQPRPALRPAPPVRRGAEGARPAANEVKRAAPLRIRAYFW